MAHSTQAQARDVGSIHHPPRDSCVSVNTTRTHAARLKRGHRAEHRLIPGETRAWFFFFGHEKEGNNAAACLSCVSGRTRVVKKAHDGGVWCFRSGERWRCAAVVGVKASRVPLSKRDVFTATWMSPSRVHPSSPHTFFLPRRPRHRCRCFFRSSPESKNKKEMSTCAPACTMPWSHLPTPPPHHHHRMRARRVGICRASSPRLSRGSTHTVSSPK